MKKKAKAGWIYLSTSLKKTINPCIMFNITVEACV